MNPGCDKRRLRAGAAAGCRGAGRNGTGRSRAIRTLLGRLTKTFEWVGGRFSGGPLVPTNDVVHVQGDLAYTVGFERGTVCVDGGPPHPMTIRATHVYQREHGRWHIIHRHADFPPRDERQD